jgi:hypothetical protein
MRKILKKNYIFSWAFAGFLLLSLTLLCAHRPHEAFAAKSEHCATCQASVQSKKMVTISVVNHAAITSYFERFTPCSYEFQFLTLVIKTPIRGPPFAS